MDRVRAGDKVLIGSCLVETGRFLAARLCERGVRAVHIVEDRQGRAQTKAPRKRAAEVQAFIEGDAQVLCTGVNAIKLGHNLDTASTVILDGLPWSHEALDQFLARVHRLTSRRPVSVYVVLTRGSLDERKWDLLIKRAKPPTSPSTASGSSSPNTRRLEQGPARHACRRRHRHR